MKNLFFALVLALVFVGCTPISQRNTASTGTGSTSTSTPSSDVIVQKVDKDDVRDIIRQEKMLAPDVSETELSFTAVGEGIAPLNTVSSAQALALAKRAAITDGYRQLASKLYGVKVNGKDTVKDAMLRSSTITAQVNGLIKNASIIDENFNQGLYRINLELKIDADKWKELFAY
ncbi:MULTISPECIES: flagellar assembly lipoprotein FlgP [unclassified Campylobacter]|uniref:flagellar assembly lipoprotein FlgP n=1 Tax=unclassified Campylobacter TaxID=2593542 RepID=UPI001237AD31|nr:MULTISPECIES: flagellar assembly lipoprotein FlgP [unclassified Campylobacter]KAA6225386.1 lipoprotein required for motility [Campylobacter sp. LR185c]KAA6227082.1 lipoprotein required for motility [Campylobacter sp. LR196d]KAA6228708.1 lipoprotein required for motility [Campylobacter sp. LR286c]KAA6229518.1 lipoprotein required for motility [Campylobacter sp. LR264d]KAA6230762.1 lipoprotein required for motility [Campylobacter sp. LR291e]